MPSQIEDILGQGYVVDNSSSIISQGLAPQSTPPPTAKGLFREMWPRSANYMYLPPGVNTIPTAEMVNMLGVLLMDTSTTITVLTQFGTNMPTSGTFTAPFGGYPFACGPCQTVTVTGTGAFLAY